MREAMWRRYGRLWGPNVRADVDDEIDFHVQTRADRYVREGMSPADARARAEREFGDMAWAKRECRDIGEERVRQQRRADVRGALLGDVRYALRTLRRSPLFTSVAVVTLALAIGATTTLYSALDTVMLRPLPFADPERLVQIWEDKPGEDFGTHDIPTTVRNYTAWRDRADVLDDIGAFRFASFTLTGGEEAEQATALWMTPSLFRLLGIEPVVGRTFTDSEAQPGADAVIVIAHSLWQRRYGGRADIIGQVAMLDGAPRTIVGVMPPDFGFPYAQMYPNVRRSHVEIYAPFVLERMAPTSRSLGVIARLAPGVNLAQAQKELAKIHTQTGEAIPGTNDGWIVHTTLLARQVAGSVRVELVVLFSAAVLLLLIACANVGNLVLARGLTRHRELALRSALGAGRSRLVRQLLTESLVLAVIGGALGLLLAYLGVRYLVQLVPFTFPRLPEIAIDVRVALFAFVATIGTGLLFGVLPALRAGRTDLRSALQTGGRAMSASRGARSAARLLVAFQVAVAVMLLIGAGLVVRSFAELTSVRPGFHAERLLLGTMTLPAAKYRDAAAQRAAYEEIVARAARAPGVTHAALTGLMPFTDMEDFWGFDLEGAPPAAPGESPIARYYVVTPSYFETVGVPIVAGRALTNDDRSAGVRVAVINEAAAAKFWPGVDPIGKRVTFDDAATWTTIVGVSGNVRYTGFDDDAQAEIYLPLSQAEWPYMLLVVRTARESEAVIPDLRRAVASVDRDVPLSGVTTIETLIGNSLAQRRLNMLLLGGFAALAVLLSAIGLYGVLGETVARRRNEIGVRLALGSSPRAAMRLILSDGLTTIAIGATMGIAGALFGTRLLSRMLFGVSSLDPLTFTLVPVFLVLVALLASYIPARRAMRVDPLTALRAE
jgi:putative ABC transport system permease protein